MFPGRTAATALPVDDPSFLHRHTPRRIFTSEYHSERAVRALFLSPCKLPFSPSPSCYPFNLIFTSNLKSHNTTFTLHLIHIINSGPLPLRNLSPHILIHQSHLNCCTSPPRTMIFIPSRSNSNLLFS